MTPILASKILCFYQIFYQFFPRKFYLLKSSVKSGFFSSRTMFLMFNTKRLLIYFTCTNKFDQYSQTKKVHYLNTEMVQYSDPHCSTLKLAFSASESNLIMGRTKFMQSCCLKCIPPLLLNVTKSKMSHNFSALNQLCLNHVLYYIVRVIVTSKQVCTLIMHQRFSTRFDVVIPQIIPFD